MKKVGAVVTSVCACLILAGATGLLVSASNGLKDWDVKNWGTNVSNTFNDISKSAKTYECVTTINVSTTGLEGTYTALPDTKTYTIKSTDTVSDLGAKVKADLTDYKDYNVNVFKSTISADYLTSSIYLYIVPTT